VVYREMPHNRLLAKGIYWRSRDIDVVAVIRTFPANDGLDVLCNHGYSISVMMEVWRVER